MHYALTLASPAPWPAVSVRASGVEACTSADGRWQRLASRLASLREHGRRAVRIVDVNCGDGSLLIQAAKEARDLGFLSIEGLGVDADPEAVADACRQAQLLKSCAIGLEFRVDEPLPCLLGEAEFPADILLYAAPASASRVFRDAVRHAGDLALRSSPVGSAVL